MRSIFEERLIKMEKSVDRMTEKKLRDFVKR